MTTALEWNDPRLNARLKVALLVAVILHVVLLIAVQLHAAAVAKSKPRPPAHGAVAIGAGGAAEARPQAGTGAAKGGSCGDARAYRQGSGENPGETGREAALAAGAHATGPVPDPEC